jgi:hypothetical protein
MFDSISNLTLFGFSFLVLFTTCKGTSNFLIQVSQSKFIVLNIMSRKIFGEFVEIFLKVLNLFKIQIIFRKKIPEFINSNSVGKLNSFPKRKLFLSNLSSSMKSLEIFG